MKGRAKEPRVKVDRPGQERVGERRRREKRERVRAFLEGKPLLIGLDLGKRRHAAWLVDRDLVPVGNFMTEHSHAGLTKLVERVEAARLEGGFERAIFFMEATSYFWENVAYFLEARNFAYRLVSSLAVDREREIAHLTYAKGDLRDAELIASLGRNGNWLVRQLERDPVWREMRILAHEHEVLLVAEIAERLRLRALLGLVLPEFFDYFADPFKKTSRTLIRSLSRPPHEVPCDFAALRKRLLGLKGERLAWRKLRALEARLGAETPFGVEHALTPTLVRAGFVLDRFEFLAEQREHVRGCLVALYEDLPCRRFLDTIPGVSAENHAILLGLVGDPKRYDRATCLVKLAGIEPRENHSGDGEGSHSISRRGQGPTRSVLYRIVCGLNLVNEDFAAYVTRLRKRDENAFTWHQAAIAAGNKYLRVFHHICVKEEGYNATKVRAQN